MKRIWEWAVHTGWIGGVLGRRLLAVLLAAMAVAVPAQNATEVDRSPGNLMVVLRESIGGATRKTESLEYIGKLKARLPDGKEVEFDMAHYAYIGDMHLRFVFDGPNAMLNATSQDLKKLNVGTPEEALRLAVKNISQVYGKPKINPFAPGLYQLEGNSPDLNSSYFLDKEFWTALGKEHSEGIVVAVPKRGGLVYTWLSDKKSVEVLRKQVALLHSSSDRLRVSSALYLFKDGGWSVFQEPARQ